MSDAPINYILCSNPRSGTTLMCGMLEQSGVAGTPNSYFREKSMQDWCDLWEVPGPIDLYDWQFAERYLAAMLRVGRGGTPVFGLRLMGLDLGYATRWLRRIHPQARSDVEALETVIGPLRFIHLSRQDKLAEAVSYLRAEQTGLWHRHADGSVMEQIAPTEADGFNADRITQRLSMLTQFDQDWKNWFEAEGITPLRLTYEALADDPRAGLAAVLNYIGQDPAAAAKARPGLRKLADTTSADWIRRYRELFPNS